mmetsp:Transcript_113209/g.330894  ORF Transcript_113209/g.330894 Transcript_113209/m.330894 type:complete len:80 (+) Transcript_113209:1002-1241(+)
MCNHGRAGTLWERTSDEVPLVLSGVASKDMNAGGNGQPCPEDKGHSTKKLPPSNDVPSSTTSPGRPPHCNRRSLKDHLC